MKRELIALIIMLAIGLQGSLAAFAASSPWMSPDCQSLQIADSHTSQDSCCPKGQRAMSCCLDLCLSSVAVTFSVPTAMILSAAPAAVPAGKPPIFHSRGNAPPIRPPIL